MGKRGEGGKDEPAGGVCVLGKGTKGGSVNDGGRDGGRRSEGGRDRERESMCALELAACTQARRVSCRDMHATLWMPDGRTAGRVAA